jgi:predicted dehydrogenase
MIASGQLGELPIVRVYNLMEHPRAPLGPVGPVPEEFDYDLWCGPAAMPPYHPSRRWLNYSEFSCGPIAGDAIHQLDLARYLMNDPIGPRAVSHMGGLEVLRDGRDTADTQVATFDFGEFKLIFQAALWMPYMKKTPFGLREEDQFPNWPFSSTKIELLGTKGAMYLGRHGGGWQVFDGDQQPVGQAHGRQADQEHIANFIDCIRSRQRPNSDVAQGHASTALCHLVNAVWQAGNHTLTFDPETETFPEEASANIYLGRSYRSPWVLPRVG